MKSLSELAFPVEAVLTLPALPPPFLKCITRDECTKEIGEKDLDSTPQNGAPLPFAISSIIMANIDSAKCHTKGEDVKTVFELQIDIKELNPNYLPGDTIGILPKNSETEITSLLKRLGLFNSANELLKTVLRKETTKKKASVPNYIPPVSTVFEILESCVDIRAVPKKLFLRSLCDHTEDPKEKRRLEELCSREGMAEYNKYFIDNGCTLMDLLQVFSSCNPPFSLLLEHLPRLQPRAYSIASSPLENPNKISIVLNIFEGPRGRKGVCSSWLYKICQPLIDLSAKFENLQLSRDVSKIKVPLYLRKPTSFRIPDCISTPLLMVGPGTGVAPFIGFLQHRKFQYINFKGDKGDNWLFFGCRYSDRDFIFKKELDCLIENGTLLKLSTSFSRDSPSSSCPKYVQDNIRNHKEEFLDNLLNKGSHLFICGDMKGMVRDVEEMILHCIMEVKGKTETEAKELYSELEKNGFIQKDIWL